MQDTWTGMPYTPPDLAPNSVREKSKDDNKKSLSKLCDFSSEVKVNLGKGVTTLKIFNNRYSANKGHLIFIPFKGRMIYNLNSVLSKVIWKHFYPSLQVHKSHSTRFLRGKLAF